MEILLRRLAKSGLIAIKEDDILRVTKRKNILDTETMRSCD